MQQANNEVYYLSNSMRPCTLLLLYVYFQPLCIIQASNKRDVTSRVLACVQTGLRMHF